MGSRYCLHYLQAISVLVPEREHGRDARPAQQLADLDPTVLQLDVDRGGGRPPPAECPLARPPGPCGSTWSAAASAVASRMPVSPPAGAASLAGTSASVTLAPMGA